MRGFLEARCLWEPGSRLATSDLSPFRLSPKVSGANVRWANANYTFLAHKNPWTDTFLRDISPAKLCSTARVRNPQGISNLVYGWLLGSLRFAQSNSAGLPSYKILRRGILNLPLSYGTHLKISPEGHHIFEWLSSPNGSEALWMWCAIVGADHSASLSLVLQGSQVRKAVLSWYCFCMWLPHRNWT
jgi:hypothetical protein